jgi:hypothetical protein
MSFFFLSRNWCFRNYYVVKRFGLFYRLLGKLCFRPSRARLLFARNDESSPMISVGPQLFSVFVPAINYYYWLTAPRVHNYTPMGVDRVRVDGESVMIEYPHTHN